MPFPRGVSSAPLTPAVSSSVLSGRVRRWKNRQVLAVPLLLLLAVGLIYWRTRPPQVAAGPQGTKTVPTSPAHSGALLAILGSARLGGAGNVNGGCLWLVKDTGERISVVWPYGYRATFGPVQLIDPKGRVAARDGDLLVGISGGSVGPTELPDGVSNRCVVAQEVWEVNPGFKTSAEK